MLDVHDSVAKYSLSVAAYICLVKKHTVVGTNADQLSYMKNGKSGA
jgi:hypothetical protein